MIYADFAATTPTSASVKTKIKELLDHDIFGNPSSSHEFGESACKVMVEARERVAALINCQASEVVFTSCASESNNWVIKAISEGCNYTGHIISSAIEHPSIEESLKAVEKKGMEVTRISPCKLTGVINPSDVALNIRDNTVLVSIIHTNNETFAVSRLDQIVEAVKSINPQILIHTDASQSATKVDISVNSRAVVPGSTPQPLNVDLMTLAGHKIFAPKGVGALFIRTGVAFDNLLHGGGQECGRRAGTENLLLAAALGQACHDGLLQLRTKPETLKKINDVFFNELTLSLGKGATVETSVSLRDPTTTNYFGLSICFPGCKASGQEIVAALKEKVAISASAAYNGLSRVLSLLENSNGRLRSTIRVSFGFTDEEEIRAMAKMIAAAVNELY